MPREGVQILAVIILGVIVYSGTALVPTSVFVPWRYYVLPTPKFNLANLTTYFITLVSELMILRTLTRKHILYLEMDTYKQLKHVFTNNNNII